MVRTVIPFRPAARDAEADAFVAERLRQEQGETAAPGAERGEIADVWDALGQMEADDFAALDTRAATGRVVNRRAWIAGGTLAAGLALGGVFLWPQQPVIHETDVGERRTIALPDGSRVTLNTASRIEVVFAGRRRQVVLAAGEAFFAVQRQADQAPFDVFSHQARIRVTGTRFNVYRRSESTEVDLLEGGVLVGPAEHKAGGALKLAAGQAVRVSATGRPGAITSARAGRVEDWQRGRVSFEHTPLSAAVTEMNRYSRFPIVLDDPALETLQVDGVFEAGDTSAFAKALHGLHGVSVRRAGAAWRLS